MMDANLLKRRLSIHHRRRVIPIVMQKATLPHGIFILPKIDQRTTISQSSCYQMKVVVARLAFVCTERAMEDLRASIDDQQ